MPRLTLRTVLPAKWLACQSAENRCTRKNASPPIAVITFRVSRITATMAPERRANEIRPSSTIAANAQIARRPASSRPSMSAAASASTSLPANSGTRISASVAPTLIPEPLAIEEP